MFLKQFERYLKRSTLAPVLSYYARNDECNLTHKRTDETIGCQ